MHYPCQVCTLSRILGLILSILFPVLSEATHPPSTMIFERAVAFFWFALVFFGRTRSWARPELPKHHPHRGPDSGQNGDLISFSKSNLAMASGRHLLSADLTRDNESSSETMVTENHTAVAHANATGPFIEEVPSWVVIFDTVQNSITGIGFLLNMLTVITLTKNGSTFPKIINFLLRHQSVADGTICIMAILINTIPFDTSTTGLHVLDVFLCHVWFSQGLYWAAILISIANLLLISVERFLAICYPFKHKQLTIRHIRITLIVFYILNFTVQIFPTYISFHFADGRCVQSPPFSLDIMGPVLFFVGIWAFCIYWAIPCALFVIIYGIVIYTLTKRNKQSTLGHSEVVAKASEQITKTAIVVTIFFFISIGYDLWYYGLANWGVVIYKNNTPVQKGAVFFAVLNSCANPVIYAAFMPAYRKSIRMTLFCTEETDTKSAKEKAASSSTSTVNTTASEHGGAI